jgi:dsDNA-specific endonuclease/ATPase MutS2
MITLQIKTLEKYLHLAIVHRIERMIVIHGLGKGALKDAVHQTLQEMPEVKHFRNEWMGKYGYGATEIIFKR